MTDEQIIEIAKRLYGGGITAEDLRKHQTIEFARLIEQATREADIAIAHDFIQYHMDFDKADECAKEMRSQKWPTYANTGS